MLFVIRTTVFLIRQKLKYEKSKRCTDVNDGHRIDLDDGRQVMAKKTRNYDL